MATEAPAVKTPSRTGKSPLKTLMGPVGSPEHRKKVEAVVDKLIWYGQQQQEWWANTVRWTKRYMAQKEEMRKLPEEEWRAKVVVPDPYSGVETKVAILTDIITGSDPLIQAEGIHRKDYDPAKKVEHLLNYTSNYNRMRGKTIPGMIRMSCIQGTEHFKLIWLEDTYEVEIPVGEAEVAEFGKALSDAFNALNILSPDQVPDWMMDPQGFMNWRETANKALGGKVVIPEPPMSGKREIIRYRGPKIERISLYDLFIDPLIDDMQDQPFVAQRILKPESWVRAKVKSGAWDADAVEKCIKSGAGDSTPNKNDQVLDAILGVKQNKSLDPTLTTPLQEIYELWQIGSDTPYAVMLNRQGFVNKDPGKLPFAHAQIPIGSIRNVRIPGRAVGLSEVQINESMYDEQDTMRNLRLDRTKLETFPAFSYQDNYGMPELKRKLAPGMLIKGRPGMFSPLFNYTATHAFEEMRLSKENIADANATYYKGQEATINRVSATDANNRTGFANIRHKLQAVGIEDALQMYPEQGVALWFQKAPADLRIKIGGAPDAAVSVSKSDLLEALNISFQFRAATMAINRDTIAQKCMEIMKDANPILTPVELRACLRVFVDQLQVPQGESIVTPEGDAFYQATFDMTAMKQKMDAEMMKQQIAATLNPVPTEVSPEVAASLTGAPTGQGAPPPVPSAAVPPPGNGAPVAPGAPGAAPLLTAMPS